MPHEVEIGGQSRWQHYLHDPQAILAEPPPTEPTFTESIENLGARIRARVGKVRFERDLAAGHPEIRRLVGEDEKRRATIARYGWLNNTALFRSAFETRRLRLLNSLFLAGGKFGAQPSIRDVAARDLSLRISEASVRFRLDHPDAKPDRQGMWKTREGFADVIRLVIEGPGARTFADAEETSLETDLTDILVSLVVAAELNYRASAAEGHRRELEWRRRLEDDLRKSCEEAERKALQARIAAEAARRAALLSMASDLRAADEIRALVQRVRATFPEGVDVGAGDVREGPTDMGGVAPWSRWALDVAERLDPVSRLQIDPSGHARLADPVWADADTDRSRAGRLVERAGDGPWGKLKELPTKGNISAVNIPHASIVFDLHDTKEVTAELLGGNGRATETVAYANLVSFTCLKAFAFEHRRERKDAHDLLYCLEHVDGGTEAAVVVFAEALAGPHAEVIGDALTILARRFTDAVPDEGYLREGPVAVAKFEVDGADDDEDVRQQRSLRQRDVNTLIRRFLAGLEVELARVHGR